MGIIAQCCFNWFANYFRIKESETYFLDMQFYLKDALQKEWCPN